MRWSCEVCPLRLGFQLMTEERCVGSALDSLAALASLQIWHKIHFALSLMMSASNMATLWVRSIYLTRNLVFAISSMKHLIVIRPKPTITANIGGYEMPNVAANLSNSKGANPAKHKTAITISHCKPFAMYK